MNRKGEEVSSPKWLVLRLQRSRCYSCQDKPTEKSREGKHHEKAVVMPTRKRKRRERTHDWQEIQQYTLWPEQEVYERLRPVVLFGEMAAERAKETGTSERTLHHLSRPAYFCARIILTAHFSYSFQQLTISKVLSCLFCTSRRSAHPPRPAAGRLHLDPLWWTAGAETSEREIHRRACRVRSSRLPSLPQASR